jgi:hypothetical protein
LAWLVAFGRAAARLAAARERVAAIERGEAGAGGLGKPLDVEAVLKAAGWSADDIEHVRETTEVYRLLAGDDEAHSEIVMRKLTAESIAAMERFDRKLVRRLLVELRALEPETGEQP